MDNKALEIVIRQLEDIQQSIERVLIMDSNMLIYFVDNNVLTNLEYAIALLKLERGIN